MLVGEQGDNIYDIARSDIEELTGHAKAVSIAKGDRIVESGGFNDSVYIIDKGILRAYRSLEDPNLTLWFAFSGDIIVFVGLR